MSRTGATEAQIEAAAYRKRQADAPGYSRMVLGDPTSETSVKEYIRRTAAYLVDPDHAIVRRSDVAALVTFYRAMLAEATAASDGTVDDAATVRARMVRAWESVTTDVLARLTAALEEES